MFNEEQVYGTKCKFCGSELQYNIAWHTLYCPNQNCKSNKVYYTATSNTNQNCKSNKVYYTANSNTIDKL